MSILLCIAHSTPDNTNMYKYKHCANPQTNVAAFICRVMADHGIANPTHLAEICGMEQPTIQRILTGKIKNPSRETLLPFLNHFSLTYDQVYQVRGAGFYVAPPPGAPSAKARMIAAKWDRLGPESKKCIATLIDVLSEKSTKSKEKV